jgi:hypothetical protein
VGRKRVKGESVASSVKEREREWGERKGGGVVAGNVQQMNAIKDGEMERTMEKPTVCDWSGGDT